MDIFHCMTRCCVVQWTTCRENTNLLILARSFLVNKTPTSFLKSFQQHICKHTPCIKQVITYRESNANMIQYFVLVARQDSKYCMQHIVQTVYHFGAQTWPKAKFLLWAERLFDVLLKILFMFQFSYMNLRHGNIYDDQKT